VTPLWLAALAAHVAADSGQGGPDFAVLSQYGVLGLVVAVLGWYAKNTTGRESARADRMEAEVFRLNGIVQEKVIPALESAARTVEEAQGLLASMQREREYALQRRTRRDGDGP
jgi:hypothetical protein